MRGAQNEGSKLKLAMVSPYSARSGLITGGVEGAAHSLIMGLRKIAEMEIHVIAPAYHRQAGVERREGVTIHWLEPPRLPAFLSNWSLLRIRIHNRLAQINPAIVHFQGVASWLMGYKKPHVFTVHGIYEKDMLYEHRPFAGARRYVIGATERLGRRASRNIILISPYLLTVIGEQIRGRVWHIENPVPQDFFDLQRANHSCRVLYAGRISRLKNVKGLLRAFAAAKRRVNGATLHIAGMAQSLEYERSCRRFVSESGLSGNVAFLGNIDRTGLLQEFRQASCLALLSYQETAPMVVEESMAAGVPVVASRICGLPYLVEDGRTGYLVDPRAEGDISDRLVRLLEDEGTNSDFGRRGREAARMRFHAEAVAKRTLAVYHQVLAGCG